MLGEDDRLCYNVFTSCLGKSECYVELVQLEIGCGPVGGNTNHMEVAYWCEEYGKVYYIFHADMILHIHTTEQIYEKICENCKITITYMYNYNGNSIQKSDLDLGDIVGDAGRYREICNSYINI